MENSSSNWPNLAGARQSDDDAVIKTIQKLKLDELLLGPIVTEDVRISTALEIGLLTEDHLALLYDLPEDEQRSLKMGPVTRVKLDSTDPFFWRSLLDIFCRAFIASSGRRAWPLTRMIDLAFDLDEIMTTLLPDREWDEEAALKILREKEPYKTKYPPTESATPRSGVGENRVREIIGWMGPMDHSAMFRLEEKFGATFFEVCCKRLAARPRDLTELKDILGVDGIGSAVTTSHRNG